MTQAAFAYSQRALAQPGAPTLCWHTWAPAQPPRAALLLAHGYLEHAGRYAELGACLAAAGVHVGAVDLRGHGRSAGARGFIAAIDEPLQDLQRGLEALPAGLPRFVLGHSFGGLLALLLPCPDLRGLILSNPYLAPTTLPPWPKRLVGNLAGRLWPGLRLPAGLRATDLSQDPERQRAHAADPLILTHATAGWYRAVQRAQRRAQALTVWERPLLYLFSDADPVADPETNARLAAQLRCPDKTVRLLAGQRHEILQETGRQQAAAQIRAWLLERAAAAPPG